MPSTQSLFARGQKRGASTPRPLRAVACCAAIGLALSFAGKARGADQASASTEVPVNVTINQSNWEKYQQYMSEGMKAVWRGDHFFHFPAGTELKLAAPKSMPLPSFYSAATKKYAGQAKLVPTSDGGYVTENYQGGLPFPDPLSGDKDLTGQRIFWDLWYRYHPRVEAAANCSYILDQYGNMTRTADTTLVYSQLSGVTDPGYQSTDSHAGPYYYVAFGLQTAPEAGKYLTTLNMLTQDPADEPQLYEFVPTLRRSLRLSQSARCAPMFGTDLTFDDSFEGPPGLPQLFKIEYLGERKLIALTHANPASFQKCGTATSVAEDYYYPGGKSIVPMLRTSSGDWEVRDVYAISLKRLPQHSNGYCYGDRVIYVDKENYFPLAMDLYDASGNLYKWVAVFLTPSSMPGDPTAQVLQISGNNTAFAVNFQDRHVTVFIGLKGCTDSECDGAGYGDATRWALPEGLAKIMQ